MRKAIAVSQIILLVLGIIVLAVIGYLLYTNFVSSNSGINQQKCNADQVGLCTQVSLGATSLTAPPSYKADCGSCPVVTTSSCQALGITVKSGTSIPPTGC